MIENPKDPIFKALTKEQRARQTLDTNFVNVTHLTDSLLQNGLVNQHGKLLYLSTTLASISGFKQKEVSKRLRDPNCVLRTDELIEIADRYVQAKAGNEEFKDYAYTDKAIYPAYKLSKVLTNKFVRQLSDQNMEVGFRQITVNAIHPGWVRTDMGGP